MKANFDEISIQYWLDNRKYIQAKSYSCFHNGYVYGDNMQFDKINFVQTTLETQLHLLIDNAFLPIVDDRGVFQGLLTRREWIKAFNYVVHTYDQHYESKEKISK